MYVQCTQMGRDADLRLRGLVVVRDLSKTQFLAALKRRNIQPDYLGYYRVGNPDGSDGGLHLYAANAGDRRRSQLAYLIKEQQQYYDRLDGCSS